jgi:alanine racemase
VKGSSYQIAAVADILKYTGSLTNAEETFDTIITDSRKIGKKENAIFFALEGKDNDGHKYVIDLYEKGVKNFVVSQSYDDLEANFIVVPDTLKALQTLATHHRSKHKIKTLAITGSNGKTIVKEWLYQLLHDSRSIVRSPRSYNSQLGVPLSVWQIQEAHELGVFEAGISLPGEMQKLARILQPNHGIFTNIRSAHQAGFANKSEKLHEKMQLFHHVDKLFYCADHQDINEYAEQNFDAEKLFTWSREKEANLKIIDVGKSQGNSIISFEFKGQINQVSIPFTDDASLENACHCLLYILVETYPFFKVKNRFRVLEPVEMRLEQKQGINNSIIINDAYNSDINSLEIALNRVHEFGKKQKKTLILSDLMQISSEEDQAYLRLSQLLKKASIDRFIGVGSALARHKKLFHIPQQEFYLSTNDLINDLDRFEFTQEVILIKGARRFRFEHIVKELEQKTHETALEVNLDSLIHNLEYFRSRIDNRVKVMAMLKAFAYGTGSIALARKLQAHNVDYIGVAYTDEGVELRKAGITTPIVVLNPQYETIKWLFKYNLEPAIYSFEMLEKLEKTMLRSALVLQYLPIHIELDTGMHRLGFKSDDAAQIAEHLNGYPNLTIASVYSHLAASDEEMHDSFTESQIREFKKFCTTLKSLTGQHFLKHIANTSGIIRHPQSHLDMVRLGIGLYGIETCEEVKGKLETVGTLRSTITQVKEVKKGDSIGYSRAGFAKDNMMIAIVPVGYADGIDRRMGNGHSSFYVNGKQCPTVGRICMDLTMIDVSSVQVKTGDDVEIFGNNILLDDLAQQINSIPYEILAGIPSRVKRIYTNEKT